MEIRKLNTLRGLAALIVLVSHYSKHTNWLSTNLGAGAGQLGVMIFFMLSGFLMSYLYIRKGFNTTNVRNYAVARAARVLPLFIVVVTLSYLSQGTSVAGIMYDIHGVNGLLSHLLLLKGVSVLWTIGPEVQFYALFIVIWGLSSRYLGLLLVFAGFVMVALFFLRFPNFNGELWGLSISFTLFRCLPYFVTGIILGHLYNNLTIPKYLRTGWFALSLLFIPLLYPRIFFAVTGTAHGQWTDFGVLLVLTAIFFCVVFLVPNKNILLENKLGDFLGKISYFLYLLHMPILFQLKKYDIANLEMTFIIFITLCLAISYMSYRLIELPSSNLIRKLGRKPANVT